MIPGAMLYLFLSSILLLPVQNDDSAELNRRLFSKLAERISQTPFKEGCFVSADMSTTTDTLTVTVQDKGSTIRLVVTTAVQQGSGLWADPVISDGDNPLDGLHFVTLWRTEPLRDGTSATIKVSVHFDSRGEIEEVSTAVSNSRADSIVNSQGCFRRTKI